MLGGFLKLGRHLGSKEDKPIQINTLQVASEEKILPRVSTLTDLSGATNTLLPAVHGVTLRYLLRLVEEPRFNML